MASGPRDTIIYHNPKCSTSRKPLDLLRDNGFEPTIVQYLKRLARPIDAVREIL